MLTGGRQDERARILRASIQTTLEDHGVLPRLAKRIAFQLILKFDHMSWVIERHGAQSAIGCDERPIT
jgi:hypothetical protein